MAQSDPLNEINVGQDVQLLRALVAKVERLEGENTRWTAAAAYGDGSPCYTPNRLQKSLIALLDRAELAEQRLAAAEAKLKAGAGKPVAWIYEVAARYDLDRMEYTDFGAPQVTLLNPANTLKAMKNITPLYTAPGHDSSGDTT